MDDATLGRTIKNLSQMTYARPSARKLNAIEIRCDRPRYGRTWCDSHAGNSINNPGRGVNRTGLAPVRPTVPSSRLSDGAYMATPARVVMERIGMPVFIDIGPRMKRPVHLGGLTIAVIG